jgi:hypothetical protein
MSPLNIKILTAFVLATSIDHCAASASLFAQNGNSASVFRGLWPLFEREAGDSVEVRHRRLTQPVDEAGDSVEARHRRPAQLVDKAGDSVATLSSVAQSSHVPVFNVRLGAKTDVNKFDSLEQQSLTDACAFYASSPCPFYRAAQAFFTGRACSDLYERFHYGCWNTNVTDHRYQVIIGIFFGGYMLALGQVHLDLRHGADNADNVEEMVASYNALARDLRTTEHTPPSPDMCVRSCTFFALSLIAKMPNRCDSNDRVAFTENDVFIPGVRCAVCPFVALPCSRSHCPQRVSAIFQRVQSGVPKENRGTLVTTAARAFPQLQEITDEITREMDLSQSAIQLRMMLQCC